jgi:hypothetical protein
MKNVTTQNSSKNNKKDYTETQYKFVATSIDGKTIVHF